MFDRHVLTVANQPQRLLSLTAPVAKRVLHDGTTVATVRSATLVPAVLTNTAMRRALRPGASGDDVACLVEEVAVVFECGR
jgi:hypothetical protein